MTDTKRKVDVEVTHSSFIDRIKHNGRGVLSVFIGERKYDFKAPIEVADQGAKLAQNKRSIGKWFNHSLKGNYPPPN